MGLVVPTLPVERGVGVGQREVSALRVNARAGGALECPAPGRSHGLGCADSSSRTRPAAGRHAVTEMLITFAPMFAAVYHGTRHRVEGARFDFLIGVGTRRRQTCGHRNVDHFRPHVRRRVPRHAPPSRGCPELSPGGVSWVVPTPPRAQAAPYLRPARARSGYPDEIARLCRRRVESWWGFLGCPDTPPRPGGALLATCTSTIWISAGRRSPARPTPPAPPAAEPTECPPGRLRSHRHRRHRPGWIRRCRPSKPSPPDAAGAAGSRTNRVPARSPPIPPAPRTCRR